MQKDYSTDLPERFTRNILGLYGENGKRWLKNLPDLIAEIAGKWSLVMEEPFANLSFHYVAPCIFANGTKAVLKVGYAEENSIIYSEAKTLKFLDGSGAVRLLKFDKNLCAILLERLSPGENLVELCESDDAKATKIAIDVMKKFWRTPPSDGSFPTLQKWTKGLYSAENTPFPQTFIENAKRYYAELIASSKQSFLLHGDLHHENILSAEREPFLAIDPKGIVGDIGFEISVFLNNPRNRVLKHSHREEILKKRLKMFSESFEIEREDLRKWAYSEAVLSAWWTFEDNGQDYEKQLACAEMWDNLEI